MCVSYHKHPYKCCYCLPLFFGVICIAAMEVFCLIGAITVMDIFCIAGSSVLLCLFVVSFINRKNVQFREALYYSYYLSLVIFLVYGVYLAITEPLNGLVKQSCDLINEYKVVWPECTEKIPDYIWVFYSTYLVLVTLFRIVFIRILYFYKEECEEQTYQKLAGQRNRTSSYGSHSSNHSHEKHHKFNPSNQMP